MYGLDNENLSEDDKIQLEKKLFNFFDKNNDGIITLDEFKAFIIEENSLPDLGFKGHHEDFETEFDIHYMEVNHENSQNNQWDWNDSEYIEHFKKHNEIFFKNALLDKESGDFDTINDLNIIIIPKKYLKK
ncbi:hypothetical protein PCK2_000765 [Pneumocystis canis]|nr:hypothetical protein PCK2_000765 [Pneumocystis canis]